ncbi:MAG: hypothetical protein ACLSCV_11495 [Acutalibacteraceae bacterium]
MEVALDEVLKQGKVAEACMCYTGDILDESRTKYSLQYYINMAKSLKNVVHISLQLKICPACSNRQLHNKLIKELKNNVGLPIHLHTHDTSGNGVASLLMAAQAGVDIVDTAVNSMAGLTSQRH